jgi:type I restriction enzyme S subunit
LIWEPPDNLIVSTGFAVLTPVSMPLTYFHLAVTTDEFVGHLTGHATGAAYPAVTARDFEAAAMLKPADSVLADFDRVVSPCFAQQEVLKRQIAVLKPARDALLPRLMSCVLTADTASVRREPPARGACALQCLDANVILL